MTAASPDRYAVIGNPVEHSRSPFIHAAFAAQTGQDMVYERLPAPLDGFAETVRRFRVVGGRGLNVTVPFKLEAHALASTLTDRAAQAGAVNTLRFDGDAGSGTIFGDNTDGVGLVRDLARHGVVLNGARVLLLGAGGAARGVLGALLAETPALVVIANRTLQRAQELAGRFAVPDKQMDDPVRQDREPVTATIRSRSPNHRVAAASASPALATGAPIEARAWADLDGPFDIVINATSASLSGASLPLRGAVFDGAQLVYDMMYGAQPSAFMETARAYGARQVADGLGMLVEQAAESFFVWRGVRPETDPVLSALRAMLTAGH